MIEAHGWREAWEAGEVFEDYWLTYRKCETDAYLPHLKILQHMKGMHPVWYLGQPVTLNGGQTARLRIGVDPGFVWTMLMGTSSAASPADGAGAAQVQIFDTSRRRRMMDRPIVSPVTFGTAGEPFILKTPYQWTLKASKTGTAPMLVVIQNRAAGANTVQFVVHGWRNPNNRIQRQIAEGMTLQ